MNLREFRVKFDKTQQEIAKAIHVDTTTVSKYETGSIRPSLDTMYLIQEYTGGEVSIKDFINEKEESTQARNRNCKPSMASL